MEPPAANASSAAGQETLIGIVGRDFIMLGADSSSSSSIAVTASNLDKILVLSDPFPTSNKQKRDSKEQQTIVAAAAGNAADADRLLGVLQAHVAVREYEASVGCDVECVFQGGYRTDSDEEIDFCTPMGLDAEAVAYCARKEIADALRSSSPFQLCLLIAGMVQCDQSNYLQTLDDRIKKETNGLMDNQRSSIPFSNRIQSQINTAKRQIHKHLDRHTTILTSKSHMQNSIAMPASSPLLIPRLIWIDNYGSLQTLEYGAHGYGANFALSILDQGFRPNLTQSEALALMKECFEQLRMRYVINSPQPPCIKCVDATGCKLM